MQERFGGSVPTMHEQNSLLRLPEFPQERRTAHQYVRDTLRRAILSGALAGGTRLVQADIAAQLKVSTTPVREALRDLAADGLILFDAHRGAIVRELSIAELVEVYDIRKALEPLAIRRAVEHLSDQEIDAAAALQDRMDAERDPGVWADLNAQFHWMLERTSDSPHLRSIVKSMQDIARVYVAHSLKMEPHRIAAGNREHREFLEAMRSRDADEAMALHVKHLEATLDSILSSGKLERATTSVRKNTS